MAMSEATRYDTTRRTAGSPFDVQRLQVELRARGFDLRRVALLTYLLGAGSDRAMAYAVHARASREGWQASVYVDETGWVVRIVRTGLARPQQLSSDLSNIAAIAADFRVTMRGLIVE